MPNTGSQRRRYSPFRRQPQRVPGVGPHPAKLILIGEKPGFDEATSRPPTPFVGPAGQVLNTYLAAAAIERSEIFITNCVKEFTDYSKPTKEELERDKPELIQEILLCEPEVIGLVGAYAVTHVLGWDKADMDRRHGIPMRVDRLFGSNGTGMSVDTADIVGGKSGDSWIVMPLYHPAQVIHSPDMSPTVLDDYLRLGMLLDGEIEPLQPDIPDDQLDYRVVNELDLVSILPHVCPLVGIDTEGSAAKPWSLQFSFQAGQSFLIRGGDHAALKMFEFWLKVTKPHISLQNVLHDLPVLRAMGIELEDGLYHDTMIDAYQLCVEPQGLKPLAYRHAGMLQDSYDDIIGDAGWAIAMEYLCQVADREWPEPDAEVIKDGTGARVKKPQGVNKLVNRILADIASGKTLKDGSAVDPRERWKKLTPQAKAPVIAAMGDMRVPDLDDIDFAKASRYAMRDSDCQYRITEPLKDRIKAMGLERASDVDHAVLPMIDRMQEVGAGLAAPAFWDALIARCHKQMDGAVYQIFKLTGRDINPASSDQVADLLYGTEDKGGLGLTPPRLTDSGRGSTDDKCLEALLAEAPVVEWVQSYREADKVRGTYAEPLREMSMRPDRRGHITFKVTRQVTGRFTTAEPMNFLSIPVRTDLGEQCRYGFEAPAGRIMYDADMSQIEMRLMASESRDERLCKAFVDGRDIHSETASEMFGVSMNAVESFQRQAGKIVGFFIINGGTPRGLVNQMILYRARRKDGSKWTEDDCARMIGAWFDIYPGVRRFQAECIEEGRQTGMARENIAGRIRYVPNIWSSSKGIREESERYTYSMRIQSGAAAILKIAMKKMWDQLKSEKDILPILPPHDEVLWELLDDPGMRDLVDTVVPWAFETSVKLRVPITSKGGFGPSWGAAKQ